MPFTLMLPLKISPSFDAERLDYAIRHCRRFDAAMPRYFRYDTPYIIERRHYAFDTIFQMIAYAAER